MYKNYITKVFSYTQVSRVSVRGVRGKHAAVPDRCTLLVKIASDFSKRYHLLFFGPCDIVIFM
jgi:hypothetical protein